MRGEKKAREASGEMREKQDLRERGRQGRHRGEESSGWLKNTREASRDEGTGKD